MQRARMARPSFDAERGRSAATAMAPADADRRSAALWGADQPRAIIGAGSVVTEDVAPRAVVAGNQARVIRTLGADEAP